MSKILIIDDEIQITQMLEKALGRSKEWTIHTYNNPVTALAQIASVQPDLVLLDIMMPQMDGIAVLEEIKRRYPSIVVVMMTAYSSLDRVLSSHKLGADHYILKPFESLGDLENKIRGFLR